MALHARAAQRRRRLSLRAALLVLALVPSTATIALWALNSSQLYDNWHNVSEHNTESVRAASPVLTVFYDLQAERQLSAAALADPAGYRTKLDAQRKATDVTAASLAALPASLPADIADGVRQIDQGLRQLGGYRTAVDRQTATQQQVFDDYTTLIAADLRLFANVSDSGVAEVNFLLRPVIESLWGIEMVSREDAVLTSSIADGGITAAQRSQLAQLIGAQQLIYDDEIIPAVPDSLAGQYRAVLAGSAWTQKTQIEQSVLSASGTGSTPLSTTLGAQWQQSIAAIAPQLANLNFVYAGNVNTQTDQTVHTMAVNLIVNTAVGAAGVVLIVVITVLLTGLLRRRILALRDAALDLQTRLPDAVERLRRGEAVDTEAEFPEIDSYGGDELGLLGQALDAARGTALETAVRQVEQYRGFERLLQRIARRTQLLIGLQAKKITEMERLYEDSEVLEGLFDLDHLTARLRRYEENLVILGGGQPQRRWRKPVSLLDALRSAQGEVQDYQRIRIEAEDRLWISERAVGSVVHVLAELMENAVAFSKPPAPVEVGASRVGHGLAVEIEDRGMGMSPEQYDEANALMANPPRMDAVSRADDARLGMYVVARLAAGIGVKVEFRSSAYGGTRVVVLIPAELVLDEGPESAPVLDTSLPLPRRALRAAPSEGSGDRSGSEALSLGAGPSAEDSAPVLVAARGSAPEGVSAPEPASRLDPLPRRTRLASLATELREPRPAPEPTREAEVRPPVPSAEPSRSSAAIGAFQRQSRIARAVEEPGPQPVRPEPIPEEDRS